MYSSPLDQNFIEKITALYDRMAEAYARVARRLDFSCSGCPDNCCDSYFMHHTYLEWAYLWEGLRLLPQATVEGIEKRSAEYLAEVEVSLAEGRRPVLMCPLNESGLCRLYAHRLMICRMHGVPSSLTLPDGRRLSFPGCFRCQEILGKPEGLPTVDRTALYRELAALEAELLGPRKNLRPKVKMTIAQMIVQGPPQV
jgi:hypothetical protein